MHRVLRRFLSVQIALFALGALVHTFVSGHQHARAATAESVIGLVLLAGLVATFVVPARARAIALAVQGFALLGTMVGIVTIVVGIGPRSAFDFALHATMIATLIAGLATVRRSPSHAA
jgi:hypothetical protein